MNKLYLALEKIFLFRISGNDQIKKYIYKISRMGKFDEPKKVEVMSLMLERIAHLEDEFLLLKNKKETMSQSLSQIETVVEKIEIKMPEFITDNPPETAAQEKKRKNSERMAKVRAAKKKNKK